VTDVVAGMALLAWATLPSLSLAGQEHGRTIPLADIRPLLRQRQQDFKDRTMANWNVTAITICLNWMAIVITFTVSSRAVSQCSRACDWIGPFAGRRTRS
jgi:hypothetical protein